MLEQVLIAKVHQLLRHLLEASESGNDGFGRDTGGEQGQPRRADSARGAEGSHRPVVDTRRLRVGADVIVSEERNRSTAQSAVSIKAATIGKGDIRVIVNGLGTVTPLATVNVVTQINGQLTQVAFREGQMVKKGDFLAQIDPRPYEILQAQYEGQLVHDQGLLDQAKIDLARYQTLLRQNSIARQTEEDQVYLVKQYEGSVKTDRALIDAAEAQSDLCAHRLAGRRPRGPASRRSRQLRADLDHQHDRGPHSVAADHRHFPVPEDEMPNILPKVNADVPLQVDAYDRANVKKLATGRLLTIDNEVDTTTGMVKLRAQFENTDNKLFPSQFVNARSAAGHAARCRHDPNGGDPARRAGRLCLCRQRRQ